jgi:acylphosphatase
VQGVFYRASARDAAKAVGVSGWVRNTDDGKVELVACGSERQLQELEAWLRQGPPQARVDDLRIAPVETLRFNGFEIRY